MPWFFQPVKMGFIERLHNFHFHLLVVGQILTRVSPGREGKRKSFIHRLVRHRLNSFIIKSLDPPGQSVHGGYIKKCFNFL